MRYTVTYTQVALDALAREWLASSDRSAVSAAGDQVERELGEDAHEKGTIARGLLRQLVVQPLQIYFTVSEDDRLVTIWFVRTVPSESN